MIHQILMLISQGLVWLEWTLYSVIFPPYTVNNTMSGTIRMVSLSLWSLWTVSGLSVPSWTHLQSLYGRSQVSQFLLSLLDLLLDFLLTRHHLFLQGINVGREPRGKIWGSFLLHLMLLRQKWDSSFLPHFCFIWGSIRPFLGILKRLRSWGEASLLTGLSLHSDSHHGSLGRH